MYIRTMFRVKQDDLRKDKIWKVMNDVASADNLRVYQPALNFRYIERNTNIAILQICENITACGSRSILPICGIKKILALKNLLNIAEIERCQNRRRRSNNSAFNLFVGC